MARIPVEIGNPYAEHTGPLMLVSGHRPFFLMAALYAPIGIAAWIAAWLGHLPFTTVWHGHEMTFGFAVAAISGFLMAAVPKWTATRPVMGWPLAVLVVLWLAGRAAMWSDTFVYIDMLYLPALAVVIGAAITGAKNKRNYIVPVILMTLAGANIMFHLGASALALRVAIYLIAALLALIAGRIIPAFTQNALRMAINHDITCKTPPILERLSAPGVLVVAIIEALAPDSLYTGIAALAVGVVLFLRMTGWHSIKTRTIPLVWILHVAYVWLPLAFILKGLADVWGLVDPNVGLHALTTGAIGLMILAVASRAALGHSGRPLEAGRATVVAYWLAIAAATIRVFGPVAFPEALWTIEASGVLWIMAYGTFGTAYWSILTKPRIDGRAG
ncbi:MAG: NnrS family protein [Rhodospirillales bacterium]|nr:NnrS family protein [Rhodospirillales bacterium]MCW8952176.1 NnrS family protein [Rhodospirillales bacterium]